MLSIGKEESIKNELRRDYMEGGREEKTKRKQRKRQKMRREVEGFGY